MRTIKKLIIMGIPHHGNIGDNAIAVAEENMINQYFSQYERYVMPEEKLDICVERVEKFITEEDILLLHGGGNIGDTYETPEKGRRKVIQTFPHNKIIIFPQTAYFSHTESGKQALETTQKIYNAHPNLVILAREKKSYDFMKKYFYNAKIYLTPDIVMTLKETANEERKGALLLFRNDKEKTLDNQWIDTIKEITKREYGSYTISDMNVGNTILNNVGGAYRDTLLQEKLHEFQTAEIVITDRLHGMIFAAITQTPCIVFSNFNHKIIESYEWLRNLEYIQFCKDENHIRTFIESLKDVKNRNYDNSFALNTIVPILQKEIM